MAQLQATEKYDVRVFDVRDNGTSSVPVTVGDLRKQEQVGGVLCLRGRIDLFLFICVYDNGMSSVPVIVGTCVSGSRWVGSAAFAWVH